MTNLDLILFVGESYCKNERGISELAMLLPPIMDKPNQLKKQSSVPLPGDELSTFTLIAGLPLGSFMSWGCYGNKGDLTSLATLIKNGQQDLGAIENCYHQIKAEPEFLESVLANLYAIESVKVVAHVDKVLSASTKNDPLLPDFCHPDVLATW